MQINPKLFLQQNNIFKNKNQKEIVLPYSDEFPFYHSLDKYVEEGNKIKITFINEKMDDQSQLVNRISNCKNNLDVMEMLVKFVPELILAVKTKDIAKLIELYKDTTLQALYSSYNADFQYDEDLKHYMLWLNPSGEGTNNKGWMSLA